MAADEQTTIRATSAARAINLTGDRTRLVRVVIAPGSQAGKTPPEPLRLAMALSVSEYTRKHANGTPITVQQRIAWKRVGGSAREGVVVDGSAVHAAVIAACKEYEIEVQQHAAEPEGRFVILRETVLMRMPPETPDAVLFDQKQVETIGIPVMGRRGGKWVRWRGGIVAKIKPQYLCDLFARATVKAQPAIAPVTAPAADPPEPDVVRFSGVAMLDVIELDGDKVQVIGIDEGGMLVRDEHDDVTCGQDIPWSVIELVTPGVWRTRSLKKAKATRGRKVDRRGAP